MKRNAFRFSQRVIKNNLEPRSTNDSKRELPAGALVALMGLGMAAIAAVTHADPLTRDWSMPCTGFAKRSRRCKTTRAY